MNDKNNKVSGVNERVPEKTNGGEHNLIPDDSSWVEDAQEELEDFIESQGIHIRQ